MTTIDTKTPEQGAASSPSPSAMKADGKTVRVHRVGTFTLGCMLIFFGVLFMLRTTGFPLSYELIFRFWPVIFIFLGCEILLFQLTGFIRVRKGEEIRLTYDKTAIVLLIVLTFFAMCMAAAELSFCYTYSWYNH